MKKFLGMSLSIGLIAGIWFFIASSLGLQPWPAYIGWSIFFFEGGDFKAIKRSFPCIVLGAVLGYIALEVILLEIGSSSLIISIIAAIIVSILAFTMTIAQSLPIFSVASATFIGASHYFGLTGYLDKPSAFLQAAFVTSIGLILGIISVKIGEPLTDKIMSGNKHQEVKKELV